MAQTKRTIVELAASAQPLRIPIKIVRRRGLRHLRVSVDAYNEVSLNVPYGVSERQALEFLHAQRAWVLAVLSRPGRRESLRDYLEHHPWLTGDGLAWHLELLAGQPGAYLVDRSRRRLYLGHRAGLEGELDLIAGLRRFATEVVPPRVAALARAKDLTYTRVSIRDQRSRWGSCSDHGVLSFNWRLVLLPLCLHDYLIWHELAHLVHLNHSTDYWNVVRSFDPSYEEHDTGLTEWSAKLMRLGRVRKSAANEDPLAHVV